MATFYDSISPALQEWIEQQHIFFVASAPLSGEGHVNLSPKGLDCFRVLGPNRVAYLDLIGSGNETSAHLAENGRITFMFCSFDKMPRITRLFGRGETILPGSAGWDALAGHFPGGYAGVRQIIAAHIYQAQTSCGFAVPFMQFVDERETLLRSAEAKGEAAMAQYQIEKNSVSLDGLPAPLANPLTGR
ncbi:MAG: pyridoxamine 5'-phosphate oxidase family protein [Caldilineaceae bacterium]|nr:pyridoxamine 5'-phosphate oxidase family protein [Caldilineaceae bacterium]HRJ40912.1 pyridoxamine 5'-phosphate oxidase family protein [Caldilineaceae bacterium]